MQYNFYIGIDVGIEGGVTVLDSYGRLVGKFKMPTMKGDTKDKIMDLYKLASKIKEYADKDKCLILMEKNQNLRGVASNSNHSFGMREGEIRGILFTLKLFIESIYIVEVPPKLWQKHTWIIDDKVYLSRTKLNTKATSLLAAYRLFPDEEFHATARSYTPHDGIVDAALIALYGYLINTK